MDPAPRLTYRRLRLIRQTAQLLHRPKRTSPAGIVRWLVGVQAQDLGAAGLALRARTTGMTIADAVRARTEERSVVRTWAMRGTLHLIAAEDYPWLLPLTAERSFPGAYRRLAQEGVTGDQPARAVRLIERMLAEEGPLTRTEIAERLARLAIRTEGQATAHLVRLAALEGVACYGPERHGEPALVLARDWLDTGSSLSRESALGELCFRYVAAYGPAGPQDLATWSGLRLTDARWGWRQIADRLVELEAPLWMLPSQGVKPATGVVRLVPGFDPYLLGWKSRQFALPKEHERKVFPGGGFLHPTVLVDGLAAGTWATDRSREQPVITIRPFSRLGLPTRKALAEEVKDVGRFRNTAVELVIE